MDRKTILLTTILGLFSILLLTNAQSSVVSADMGGRGEFYGYFTNIHDTYGSNVLPILSNNQAIPDSVSSVDALIQLLKNANTSSDPQRVTGSAFIVNTMLGRSGPGNGKSISSADWTDITNRLNDRQSKGKIIWNYNISSSCQVSSFYQGTSSGSNPDDDAFFDACLGGGRSSIIPGPGIQILDDNGNTAYLISRYCANPMGAVPGVPPAQVVTPTSNQCRPIVVTAVPKTYTGGSTRGAWTGTTYTWPTDTVPVTVSTSLQNWGPFYASQKIDMTTRHTTGNHYTVTVRETRNHVTNFVEISKDVYHYVTRYRTVCSGGKKPSCRSVSYQSWEYWYTTYDYTLVYYSDGSTTRTNTSGSISYNSNGGISWTITNNSTDGVGPCFDYKLTSTMNAVTGDNKREAGETISMTPSFVNTAYTQSSDPTFWNNYRTQTKSKSSNWQVTILTTAPNAAALGSVSGGASSSSPCQYFNASSIANCSVYSSGTTVINTYSSPSPSVSATYTVPDIAAGTKICFAFSIKPSQSDPLNYSYSLDPSDKWYHTPFNPANNCIIVVKKPKVQILGGDLSTFSRSQTSYSDKSGNKFGSWVEYAIFATGTIAGTASGSAFSNPSNGLAGNTSAIVERYSRLSFTNACNGLPGCYVSSRTIADVKASFSGAGSPISGTVVPNSLIKNSVNSLTDVYTAGNVTLNASTLAPGRSVVIKATGTVTINGNQTYNEDNNGAKYKDIAQLPQLVIIADRIIINSGVTRVDAWLVATNTSGTGRIDTCDSEAKTINQCNQRLTVNGPVLTDKLYLWRTAGSEPGAGSGDPGEVFNLRSDAYFWAAGRAASTGTVQTVFTADVPPRN